MDQDARDAIELLRTQFGHLRRACVKRNAPLRDRIQYELYQDLRYMVGQRLIPATDVQDPFRISPSLLGCVEVLVLSGKYRIADMRERAYQAALSILDRIENKLSPLYEQEID